jgi:hypothetical protein
MNSEPILTAAAMPSQDHSGMPQLTDALNLSLEDLLPDSGGSIVFEGDAGNLSIQLMTDQPIIEQGVVDQLITAAGEDVSGHAYFAFGDGLTVYYPTVMQLSVVALDG